jgi:hypothetical protein
MRLSEGQSLEPDRALNQLVPLVPAHAPAVIAASGPRASYRFLEFFTANIRNAHTRRRLCARGDGVFQLAGGEGRDAARRHRERSRRDLHRGIVTRSIRADREAAPRRAAPPAQSSTSMMICPVVRSATETRDNG